MINGRNGLAALNRLVHSLIQRPQSPRSACSQDRSLLQIISVTS